MEAEKFLINKGVAQTKTQIVRTQDLIKWLEEYAQQSKEETKVSDECKCESKHFHIVCSVCGGVKVKAKLSNQTNKETDEETENKIMDSMAEIRKDIYPPDKPFEL